MALTGFNNDILDVITLVTSLFTLAFFFENFLIWFTAREVTFTWLKMFIWKQPGFIRWCSDGTWKFDLAWPDPLKPRQWVLKIGKKEIPYELKKGSVGLGPSKAMLALISDNDNGGATIPLNDVLEGKSIGATPAHISAIEKSAYSEGYQEGFNKTSSEGVFGWAKDNWQLLAIFFILMVVGTLTLYDKIISSPAAWSEANKCKDEKAILLGKLGQCGVNIDQFVATPNPPSTTQPPMSNLGGYVKI